MCSIVRLKSFHRLQNTCKLNLVSPTPQYALLYFWVGVCNCIKFLDVLKKSVLYISMSHKDISPGIWNEGLTKIALGHRQ